MINGLHAILFASDAPAARAFFREVLGWDHVDAGDGWLIFRAPPAEVAMHPIAAGAEHHELWLMCDDVVATRAELETRGVRFIEPIAERGFGLTTAFEVPGAGRLGLYQPRHPTAARR